MSGGADGGRDPGLQPERTRLAWRRTTLSGTVAAVLAVKTVLHGGPSPAGLVAGALCCALWLAFLYLAHLRIRTLTASDTPTALPPRHATAAVLCTVAMAACGAALVF
ncbi:DUF202 domain-containing protein [Streptomyces griseorubiginosus]|uniref:DUF202 domain-containing protein n=1 Tax=Streptomyces griseorubiginosus TaxID=67304 RepID=UPI002E7FEFF2|nr:DUF202 domain-containing protein [Streptomyces griseorubiginosus]WUB48226.1 DUF202 domain-containing protein [Streptomyces griseorubiginosus]WUB56751.1 DUF202 domain-containing protein [Streptomyces griseorubiginosus]